MAIMLHCNMTESIGIQLGLEDLLADLHHARRNNELGRLALLAYCEIRGWARQAGKPDIADSATRMFSTSPVPTRTSSLKKSMRSSPPWSKFNAATRGQRARI
jgi:hypothetical protein